MSANTDPDALTPEEKALQIQVLTEEWLDLEQRFDQLRLQRKAVLASITKESDKITERIHELKNEINAVKNGETVKSQLDKQTELFESLNHV